MRTKKKCPEKENCRKAHNFVEEVYHPDKYKAKFCISYTNNTKSCEYGEFCAYAHNEEEISINLIHKLDKDDDFYIFHFKTVWCPYSERNHERDLCVYAHNMQDYRRKPELYQYCRDICPSWNGKDTLEDYMEGCKYGQKCKMAHGWKESTFHPEVYKIYSCPAKECKNKHCPYFHSNDERR